jgi:sugar/nucleoside kinase (ribokinase family)
MTRPPRSGPHVTVVGCASRDLASDDGRGWRLGGGVTYAALAAARLGLRTVAIMGVDADAAGAFELDALRAAGVELALVPLRRIPVFENVETPTGRIQTAEEAGEPLPLPKGPGPWAGAAAWILAPVAGEIDDAWLEAIPGPAHVSLGWQGLLRDVRAGRRVTRRPPVPSGLLRRADLVAVSEHDLPDGLPLADLAPLLRPGAQLVVTRGHEGGWVMQVDPAGRSGPLEAYPPVPSAEPLDATGAGDTFLAALVASSFGAGAGGGPGMGSPSRPTAVDLTFAAAAGSLAVEGVGLSGVPDREAVVRRLEARA